MAGDWIKMRGNLWDDPRVGRLVDLTESTEGPVIGALYWLWATADQHSADGFMPGLTTRQIDRKTALPGFAAALLEIGWLTEVEGGIVIVKFEEHNGASAKRRCTDAQRKANGRNVSASDADISRTDAGHEEDEKRRSAELEKRREESNTDPNGSRRQADQQLPNCPHDQIVDLYHEALPELPAVKVMSEARQKAIRGFWRWVLTSKKTDGTPRAQTTDQALTWIGSYFQRTNANDFLMGRRGAGQGHSNWRCDFDFLLTEKGKRHVIEKTVEAS